MDMTIAICFALYLAVLMGVGLYSYTKSKTFTEYIIGDRGLGKWATALSAQASDMSGWLLMGLPGALYLSGLCEAWIAIGLALGTYFNWKFVAYRLRIFSSALGDAVTMPEYLGNRFHDKSNVLKIIIAAFITIFFLLYTASAVVAGATLFSTVFGFDYMTALVIGWALILIYTFVGGFLAVCWTDLIQGTLMFFALLIVPITMFVTIGSMNEIVTLIDGSTEAGYLSLGGIGEGSVDFKSIISNLAWGLGYFGMPHIIIRFMAIKDPAELKQSRIIATTWVVVTLGCAILVGIVGRAYIISNGIAFTDADAESIFLITISHMFPSAIAGFLLAAVLSAAMSTADSQLLVSASAISNDIVKTFFPNTSEKKLLWIGRVAVLIIALIALVIAVDPNNSVMDLVSDGWAGLGGAFSAIMLFSLFWSKTSLKGAIVGIVVGGSTAILWSLFGDDTGIYALIPAFLLSSLSIVAVSLAMPDKESEELFFKAKSQL